MQQRPLPPDRENPEAGDKSHDFGPIIAAYGSDELMRLADTLAIGLAIEMEPTTWESIRTAGESARPVVLKIPAVPAGIEIDPSGRLRPFRQHGVPVGEEIDKLMTSAGLQSRMHVLTARSRDIALDLLAPLVLPGRFPSRTEFRSVFRWAPLIEGLAYALATRYLAALEDLHECENVEANATSSGGECGYCAMTHTMAHFVLMSSDAPEYSLAKAARSSTSNGWTPSLGFTRARTVWSAAAGAKSAIAFGPTVFECYLQVLATARHAFRIYDALFGLTAIALSHDHAREEVLQAVTHHAQMVGDRSVDDIDCVTLAFRSAIEVLKWRAGEHSPVAALDRLGWSRDHEGDGLASPPAFRLDPTETAPNGMMLGFSALPAILRASPAQHYPRSKARVYRLKLRETEMLHIARRAWLLHPTE
ncbi:hypothetical protein P0R31_15790 [Bradyrhizobium yuanmingense]|uniref:hypothetical protein n=1 Tax=Bradyrhizobium yuanmingense TaxID=108015 RepID=UPI0023B90706|nr:hypothetical protein [Bradyrhizobium yuanmingense]MDF0518693.1 hypothetical protein [Bradyrhizobium yuanmingense]